MFEMISSDAVADAARFANPLTLILGPTDYDDDLDEEDDDLDEEDDDLDEEDDDDLDEEDDDDLDE